jgi:hypothetical protein
LERSKILRGMESGREGEGEKRIEYDTICLTISAGLYKSMRRLWMRISKRSQVLLPECVVREIAGNKGIEARNMKKKKEKSKIKEKIKSSEYLLKEGERRKI